MHAWTHLRFIEEGLQALLKCGERAGGVCFTEHLDVLATRSTLPEAEASICATNVPCDDGVRLQSTDQKQGSGPV